MKTLRDYLLTQDMSKEHVDKICNKVLNNEEIENDPISQIIVNAFENSENGTDLEQMEADLTYAITMLQKVRNEIEN